MEEESPLEVLSRAATMVSPPTYDEARTHTNKELPTAKWRRERRQQSKSIESPLDFSTRPPPSYDQTIQSRKHTRPSVIQSAKQSSSDSSGDDVSDPAIDEHFRRSLGNQYSSLFKDESGSPGVASITYDEYFAGTGLTVDDHFAKALGDTWLKLQQAKENENKKENKNDKKVNNNNVENSEKKTKKPKESSVLRDKRRSGVVSST